MRKIKTFRVKPDPKAKGYYKVFLFPTPESMYAFEKVMQENSRMTPIAAQQNRYLKFKFAALTVAYTGAEKDGRSGYILFCRKWLGGGIVAHEMVHAAFHWWEGKRRQVGQLGNKHWRKQEEFCTAVEEMSAGFWRGFYRKEKRK